MTDIHTWLLCNWHIANNWHIFTHGSQWLLCPRRFSRLTTGDRNPLWLWYHVLLACCEYLWICVRIHVNICEYLLICVNMCEYVWISVNICEYIENKYMKNLCNGSTQPPAHNIYLHHTIHTTCEFLSTNKQTVVFPATSGCFSSQSDKISESFLMLTTIALSWDGQLQ